MVSRTISRLMIVGGVLGICGAGLWWREFYSEVGRMIGSSELPVECLYRFGGTCELISEAASLVTSSAYKPGLFWVSASVLLAGIILEGFPNGEGNDVYLTRERDRDYRPRERDDREDPHF
ncbi:hypothetical protein [Aureimonas phyllosphaerae]|uniref:Uncharacterized protein n=1 Tax=Aureimonas phyllosphaerae TaxID=1166078 RepID=A0A7W6BXA2_9HYPH|nr:hypothetical protein [Aureimonas phyllosphaerae]MBB3938090.1 hypothetical protein [Aureimonas phyllosphaerae]MBB3962097.1 hypothetical protein [Aureimonas phyllosphaerae]SFF56015.1 hypothetical protein SAMN05216566_12831 [Aureimonas phyllosphaerae]